MKAGFRQRKRGIARLRKKCDIEKNYLYLKTRDDFYRLDISKIVFIEAQGNYTPFCLCNKQRGLMCVNLARMTELLKQSLGENARSFARVGRRFIINLTYVYHIDLPKGHLVMSDGARFAYQLPISTGALKVLRDLFVS